MRSLSRHLLAAQSLDALLPLLHKRAEATEQRPEHVAAAGAVDVLRLADAPAHADLLVDVEYGDEEEAGVETAAVAQRRGILT